MKHPGGFMRRFLAVASLALVFSSGCYRAVIKTPALPTQQEETETGASFVWGLTPTTTRASECTHGISKAEVVWPWWSPIVYGLTGGLVAVINTEYTCAGPGPAPSAGATSAQP